jgi:anthranilate phosphoribosyltransferase
VTAPPVDRFALYIATLGRGPGRSRALTRAEAEDAMAILLAGEADPIQIGAFLMLLRYRGEDSEEIAGLAQAARDSLAPLPLGVDLDWPSYGAGKTRGAPWFLLAALALGQSGVRVFMHGSNEFSGGIGVAEALQALAIPVAHTAEDAAASLQARGLAYMPVASLSPAFADLLGLRQLLGLRSPMNTVARLLNPARAAASVNGVFHPPYIETHMATAPKLGQRRLLVLKGGGGEAERNPAKPVALHLWDETSGREQIVLPALTGEPHPDPEPDMAAIWAGSARCAAIEARIVGTIALGLMACRQGGDAQAQAIWQNRRAMG